MKEPKPYELADATIRIVNRRAIQMFARAKEALNVADFDELNVNREMRTVYADLDRSARKRYRELFLARYEELIEWLIFSGAWDEERAVKRGAAEKGELAKAAVDTLLSEPNPVTRYAWDAEILRKRDKAVEAVNAVSGKGNKQRETERHKRYIAAQMGYYADFTSQEADQSALRDAGVQRVVRHERNDEKVCAVCRKLDGAIYEIGKIPDPEHIHCRRYFTPAD